MIEDEGKKDAMTTNKAVFAAGCFWGVEVGDHVGRRTDQERRIFYLTVLIVPGLVLLAGVQTWWRRR